MLDLQAGNLLAHAGQWSAHLWLILQGRVDLDDPELVRTHTLLAGEFFGAGLTPWTLQHNCNATATEDSRLLQVPVPCLKALLAREPALTPFLPVPLDGRQPGTPAAATAPGNDTNLLSMRLQDLIKHPPITLPPQASVLEVARTMRDRLRKLARHDPLWHLPLWAGYHGGIESDIADIVNTGRSALAGAINAAIFLEDFVPATLPWLHLDLFAWNDAARPGRPVGGEAQTLRTLLAWLEARFAG